ncbi:hypothetical protein Vretimale_10660 [Volvox reticuliferus]|uniref:Peptidase S54 rhomboid domain-containing protein n=1 Tax=Volvox reticuliferus TaxID=1737510 RepID=A0A8J4LQP9_9CHLO|nr:hypothetical protein Vretifemale_13935 [Volvox reticuliferus]GIM06327.1 hypothetical protein Vretimale_10660 [Volvox reticuliferus]
MAMTSTSQPGPSLLGVVQTWYNGLPLCTKATFSLITGVFVVQLLTGWYGAQAIVVSLVPQAVLYDFQVYRIFTAVLIHGGLLHVTFNMLAFVPMGASLERAVGSLQLLYFMVLSCLLEGILYVALSVLLATSGLVRGAMYHGAMGFSGIIFGLVVWESALSPVPFRSIFGLFQVPIAWYPWALLLFCQLLVPEASFVGHLAGLMVGQLWVWGLLRPLALSRSATTWLEQAGLMARCVRQPSFIMMPSSALPYTMFDVRGAGGGGTSGGGSLGGQGSGGVRLGGLGRNLVSLGKMFRSGSSGAAGASDGGGNGRDVEAVGGSQDRGAFAGTGRVLGGNGGSGGVAAAPPLPSVAAALAAEARIGGGGGGVAGGIPGSGVGGGIGTGGATAARDKALNS